MIVANPRTTRGKSNDPINVLRFVAALAVVVSHLRTLFFVDYSGAASTDQVTQALYLAGSLGHSAVIIFFVLSGFWVGGSVLRSSGDAKFDVGVYAISRLTRLWIVLVPAIALTQVLDRFGMLAFPTSDIYNARQGDYHSVVPTGGPSEHLDLPTSLGNFLFLQPHHVSALGTNTALWSLAYEFWYYLLFPAALLAFSASFKNRWRVLAGIVFLLGALVAGPSILALFPVWLMGAALSALGDPLKSKLLRLSPKLLVSMRWGFGAGLLCACALTVRFELNEYLSAAIVGAAATLYVATLILGSRPERPSGRLTRPLARASEWSYSLYAVHLPLLAFIAAWLIPDAKARWQMSPSSIVAAAAIVGLVCLVAVAMYWISERHTLRVRNVLVKRLKGAQSDRR